MTLPALVPTMMFGLIPFASRTFMTPICANPLAAPPPKAKPMTGVLLKMGVLLLSFELFLVSIIEHALRINKLMKTTIF